MTGALTDAVRRPDGVGGDGNRDTSGVVLAAVAALVVAEILVAFVDPVAGAVLHALLLLTVVLRWVRAGDVTLLVLALVPLGRVTSLALTPEGTGIAAYALTGLPLLIGVVWMVQRLARTDARDSSRMSWHTIIVALSGIPLGLAVYALLDLPALPDSDGPLTLALGVPLVFVMVGVLEELLFRGLVQRVLCGAFGVAGVLLADVLFVAAYLPTRDAGLVTVMAVVGLGFGFYVWRTGGLAAVAVAHGLLAAGALVVWPALG